MSARKPTWKYRVVVPIYDFVVYVVVSETPLEERKKFNTVFGVYEGGPNFDALCSSNGSGEFALFFSRRAVNVKTVAHEVFHLTHRILEYIDANFDSTHHETGAYLNGHLMSVVCNVLRRHFK